MSRESGFAMHLRGFVKPDGRHNGQQFMRWGVVNTKTGKVIASDNTCCDLARAIREADRLVAAARIAWMHSYKIGDLR